ncbi:MAG TPA: hypothetical protein VHZ73_11000 [Vicinamibacterales bacterium]|jgi:hypothetical protein|nr:hypothetical protein [Vicinamibacterales bacterium]
MRRAQALALVAAATFFFNPRPQAQTSPSIAGDWTLDRAHSEFPTEVGFGASFMPEAPAPASGGGGGGGGRGGRGGRSQRSNPVYARPDGPDDARRILLLTDSAKNPPINLTITDAAAVVTITADGTTRTFHPTGREDSIQLDQVPVGTTASRVEGHLLVVYQAAPGRELRYTYFRTENPTELVVDTTFAENGAVDSIRRVYVPGKIAAPPPGIAAPSSSTARTPGAPPSPSAAVDQSVDGPYRGLQSLAVVVEDLSAQAGACGLTRDAINSAASKSLTDAGLTVERGISSDQNTYLYINVQTTSTSSGLCVSRYDAFLYTHTAAQLAYGSAPVLAQVLLAHKGGLAGGSAEQHAQSVMSGLKGYVDEFVSAVRTANGK